METDRWKQIEQLCHAALALERQQQAAFLDGVCAGDEELRSEVESLLAYQKQGDHFIEAPAFVMAAKALAKDNMSSAGHDQLIGRRIGPYQIVERIGVGGMGEVFRAFRADDQYNRAVAIKLVRAGHDSGLFVARFKNERQILAGLDHPNIARLFDGGATEEGIPYFVMELIEGRPIDEYCDSYKLSISERLRLFQQVCSAVHYAHQRLIIHRDIKPGNILVTAEGTPKLLDFGVAKILDPALVSTQLDVTTTATRLVTPAYASPEQIRNAPVTTAADVYSLGVVLYRLLTGHLPYRVDKHNARALEHAICETEPERPSSAVTRAEESTGPGGTLERISPAEIGTLRSASPENLHKRLRGDLDHILLKALRKESEQRYTSVEQFSEDLRRHLDGIPVIARAGTLRYRAGKFIRRHKTGVIASSLMMLMLLTAMGAILRESRIARMQQAKAERRFNDVRKLANTLMFELHDAIEKLPGSTPARQLLVKNATEYLDSLSRETAGDPSLQRELATAYQKLGDVQGNPYGPNLGDMTGALASYRKALALRDALCSAKTITGQDRLDLATSYRQMGDMLLTSGDAAAALESSRKAVAISESLTKATPENTKFLQEMVRDYDVMGSIQGAEQNSGNMGDLQGSLETFRQALAVGQAMVKADPPNRWAHRTVAALEAKIGDILVSEGRRTEASENYRRALQGFLALAEPGNAPSQRDVGGMYGRLGRVLDIEGNYAGALQNYRKELEYDSKLVAADPRNSQARTDLMGGYVNLGGMLANTGDVGGGLKLLRDAVRLGTELVASDPTNEESAARLAGAEIALAQTLGEHGNLTDALTSYLHALAIYDKQVSADAQNMDARLNLAGTYAEMGSLLAERGSIAQARENFRKAIELDEPVAAAKPNPEQARYTLADAYAGLGDLAAKPASNDELPMRDRMKYGHEARSWYQQSLEAWRKIRNPAKESPNGFFCGSPEKVSRKLARLDAALAQHAGSQPSSQPTANGSLQK